MSADTGMSYQSQPTRQKTGQTGADAGMESLKPVEILAMFWASSCTGRSVSRSWLKFWQKKSGLLRRHYFLRARKMGKLDELGARFRRMGYSVKAVSDFGMGSTGNRAFDEWRTTELARLEEERQKLVAAEREFAEFMENLRHARDREEFERFMDEHRNQQERRPGNRARS